MLLVLARRELNTTCEMTWRCAFVELSTPSDETASLRSSCGADLSPAEPVRLRYRLREGATSEYLGAEPALMQLGLAHPALELARMIFSEVPYGELSRSYRIEPEFPPFPTTDIALPQEPVAVLQWGSQLAAGLDYLHRHYVTLPAIALPSVSLSRGKAVWVDLTHAQVIPPEERGNAAPLFARDVRDLARLIGSLVADGQNGHLIPTFPKAAAQLLVKAVRSPET